MFVASNLNSIESITRVEFIENMGNDILKSLSVGENNIRDTLYLPLSLKVGNLTTKIENMKNAFDAQNIRIQLYTISKKYLSKVNFLNQTLINLKEKISLLKMHSYKELSDATVKIHNIFDKTPSSNSSIYLRYLYLNPSSPSSRKYKEEYYLDKSILNF